MSSFKPSRFIGTVKISGPVTPTTPEDIYPSHKAYYGAGGYRSVDDIADRDSIVTLRREEGMIAYVISEKKEYRLEDGIENENWVLVVSAAGTDSSGTTASFNGYVPVPETIFRDSIEPSLRQEGMIAYVISEKTEYRLEGGIANTNWVKITPETTDTEVTVPTTSIAYIGVPPINEALVQSLITELQTNNGDTKYTRDGLQYVSETDATRFSFLTNTSKIHINDYMFFNGFKDTVSIDTVPSGILDSDGNIIDHETQVFTEITIEVEHNGDTEKYTLSKLMDGSESSDIFFEPFENERTFNGFLKFTEVGSYTMTVYQEEVLPAGSIDTPRISDKTVHTIEVFYKQFTATSNGKTENFDSLIETTTLLASISFSIETAPNSDLKCSLVRVDVTDKGISRNKYSLIQGLNKIVIDDTTFTIPSETWDQDDAVSGDYALLIQGKDGGIEIPPYFTDWFEVEFNYLLRNTGVTTGTSTIVEPEGTPTAPTRADFESVIDESIRDQFFIALDTAYPIYPIGLDTYFIGADLSLMDSTNIADYINNYTTSIS